VQAGLDDFPLYNSTFYRDASTGTVLTTQCNSYRQSVSGAFALLSMNIFIVVLL
jgi:hypothetical protein